MQKELIDSISFIKNSKYRHEVLKVLNEKNLMTPKDISKKVNLRLNHVSMTLGELKEYDLVECVNDTSKRGRLYKIKSLGEETLEWLNENA